MNNDALSKINFDNYLVKEINFLTNDNFVPRDNISIELDFDNNINIDFELKKATIDLSILIFKDYIEENYPFYLKIAIASLFSFQSDLGEDEIKNLLEINGVAITFPYLRSLVTFVTANSGFQPLILPTINITNLLKQKKKQ